MNIRDKHLYGGWLRIKVKEYADTNNSDEQRRKSASGRGSSNLQIIIKTSGRELNEALFCGAKVRTMGGIPTFKTRAERINKSRIGA